MRVIFKRFATMESAMRLFSGLGLMVFLPCVSFLSGRVLLRTGTDWDIIGLLKAGEFYTHILNPITALGLRYLYALNRDFPWYSVLLFLAFFLLLFLTTLYFYRNWSGPGYYISLLALSLIYTLATFNFSMTLVSALFFALAVLHTHEQSLKTAWLALLLGSLLRPHLITIFVPFYLIAHLSCMMRGKRGWKYHTIILLAMFSIPLGFLGVEKGLFQAERFSPMRNNRDLAYVAINDKTGLLDKACDSHFLAIHGWLWDENLLRQAGAPDNCGTEPNLLGLYLVNMKQKIATFSLRNRYNLFLGLLLVPLLLTFSGQKPRGVLHLLAFLALTIPWILFVVITRDVLRTTLPLLLASVFLVVGQARVCPWGGMGRGRIWGILVLLLLSFHLLPDFVRSFSLQKARVERGARQTDHASWLIHKYRSRNVILSNLPFSGISHQYPLFRESANLVRDFSNNVITFGWLSGHPLLKQKMKKGLSDLIVDEHTVFMGRPAKGRETDAMRLLQILDRYYAPPGKRHVLQIIDSYREYQVARLILQDSGCSPLD